MRRTGLAALAGTTVLAVVMLVGPAAWAANEVGPGQAFVGRVNGSFSDATVTVICPGPAGGKGHPAGGQHLSVLSPPPPVAAGIKVSVGQTGTAGRAIVAKFNEDRSVGTTFQRYFVDKAIPTSLLLPCGGTGKVVFRPRDTSATAKPSVVTVRYVNPAASAVPATSAVRGTVLFGPTCPAEQVPPDPACAPKPGAAHIELVRRDSSVAAEGGAGSDGRFRIAVAPGRYTVRATAPTPVGRGCTAAPSEVTLTKGEVVSVSVSCDTGIR